MAEKQLRICQELGVPSKMIDYEGFLCKGWQQGDSSGISVVAPMGAVVAYSNYLGIQLCVADNWMGGFTGKSYNYCLTQNIGYSAEATVINNASAEEVMQTGSTVVKNVPIPYQDPYNMLPGGTNLYADSVYWDLDDMPSPWIAPVPSAEAFWLIYSSEPQMEPVREIVEVSRTYYIGNGSNFGGRVTGIYEQPVTALTTVGSRAVYPLPSNGIQAVIVQNGVWPYENGDRVQAIYFHGNVNNMEVDKLYLSTILQHIPAELVALVLSATDNYNSCVGNYVFSNSIDGPPTMLAVIDLTDSLRVGGVIYNWFRDNPGNDHWQLSYHFHTIGTTEVYSVNSSSFMHILVDMAAVHNPPRTDPANDYRDAELVLGQLLSRPNHSYATPCDNSTWNDEFGNVYSWSRLYGAHKWTNTGITTIDVFLNPTISDNQGVRPTISHAGDGLYLCVGERIIKPTRVRCLDIGSPLIADGWVSLPLPLCEEGIDRYLVHVRPVKVTADEVVLLGVIEKIINEEEGIYHLAFLNVKEGEGQWQEMARIPATRSDDVLAGTSTSEYSNWSVTLFGNGAFVKDIGRYLSQQPVMSTMPIPKDYAGYEKGMP